MMNHIYITSKIYTLVIDVGDKWIANTFRLQHLSPTLILQNIQFLSNPSEDGRMILDWN